MLYNEGITYSQSGTTYFGDLYIIVPSIENPIIVNNVTFFFPSNEDYSNLTTIAVISVSINPEGGITIEAYDNQIDTLLGASVIGITGEAQITITA